MKKILVKLVPSHITLKLSVLVTVLIIFAFTVLEIYKFINAKEKITQDINTEQYSQAKFIAKDIKEKLQKRAQFVSGLADIISPEMMGSETRLLNELKNHLKLTNIFPQGFAVVRPDGIGLITEYPIIPTRKTFSFIHSEWFIQAQNSSDMVTSTPFVSGVNGELIIAMAKAIRNEEGKVLGILAAPIFLNDSGFMDYIFDENHRQQGDVIVVSRDKEIIVASSNSTHILKPTPPLGRNDFHDSVMNGFNGHSQSTINGSDMLTAAADVGIDKLNWFVVVRTPVNVAYSNLLDSLYFAIINGVLVSFITFLTITFSLFVFFTPLRKAAKCVNGMVEKNRSLSNIKIYKNDEIGDLIKGFNTLIEMVNEKNINLNRANAELESLSQTDGLTGVANRRYFDETLHHAWRVQARNQQPLTLLLIDIDYFKKYNDTYGHTVGDDCLKKVTGAIQSTINRPTDFFARYGGEEFVILLQGNIKEGVAIAEKVQHAVKKLNIEHRYSTFKHLTISSGVASVIPQFNSDSVELIKKADQALYQSKANGKNRYECY